MFNIYILIDWYGIPHIMSANQIHKRIMKDSSKSNHNWLTSASELMRICNKKDFPEKEAIDIKTAIVNCYAEIIINKYDNSYREATDMNAVYKAYNSLYGIQNETAQKARKNFLNSYISLVCSPRMEEFNIGKNYLNAQTEWRKETFDELIHKEELDFIALFSMLKADFRQKVKELEKNGLLAEDAKEEQERYKRFIKGFIDNNKVESLESNIKPATLVKTLNK